MIFGPEDKRFVLAYPLLVYKVDILVKEALKRLDPFDDNGDRIRENSIGIHEAVEAIGTKIRDRLSDALRDHSLEDLVKAMRVELSGLQVWNYRFATWMVLEG